MTHDAGGTDRPGGEGGTTAPPGAAAPTSHPGSAAAPPPAPGHRAATPDGPRPGAADPHPRHGVEPRQGGPVGTPREPATVVLLTVVTLGIYGYVWGWKTSKELDGLQGRPYSHPFLRIWVFLVITTFVVMAVAMLLMFGSLLSLVLDAPEGGSGEPEERFGAGHLAGILGGVLLMVLVSFVGLAAQVLAFLGFWRLWSQVRQEQDRSGIQPPLQPGTHLGIWLGALGANYVVSFASSFLGPFLLLPFVLVVAVVVVLALAVAIAVAQLYSMHQVQQHLNQVWYHLAPGGGAQVTSGLHA